MAIASAGFILTFLVYFNYRSNELDSFSHRFEKDAQVRISLIYDTLNSDFTALGLTRAFFENSESVTSKEFYEFYSALSKKTSFLSVSWLRKNPGGSYTPAYIMPEKFAPDLKRIVDLYKDSVTSAAAHAEASGSPAASWAQASPDEPYIFLAENLNRGGNSPGILLMTISCPEMFKKSLENSREMNLRTILHMGQDSGYGMMFEWGPRLPDVKINALFSRLYPRNRKFSKEFSIAGNKWSLSVMPGSNYTRKYFSLAHTLIIPSGLIFSLVLSAFFYLLLTRAGKAEEIARLKSMALDEKTRELSEFFNIAIDLLCIADTDGNFIRLNPEWEKTLGYSLKDLEGRKFLEFVHPDDINSTIDALSMLKSGAKIVDFTNRYRRSDGTYRLIEWRSAPNKNRLIYAAARDITGAKEAEKKLRASEERFRSLFDSMHEGVALHEYIFDGSTITDYRILEINPAFELHTGVKRENVIGKTSTEAYGTMTPPYLYEFSIPHNTGKPYYFETYFRQLDKNFSISVSPLGKNGFATIFLDISSRKMHERERELIIKQLEEKNAEMERFVYTVSHDLKNPLITITGFTALLERTIQDCDKESATGYLALIKKAAKSMNSLLNDLLEISRAGMRKYNIENIRYIDALKNALETNTALIANSSAKIQIDQSLYDPKHPGHYVNADSKRLSEALQNLISNAIKFAKPGENPVIHAGIRIDSGMPVYYIKDNGIGIKKEHLPRIFTIFERLNPDIDGTGVGLAIAKRIIESHSGRIWAESGGPGTGTAMCFTIGGVAPNVRNS